MNWLYPRNKLVQACALALTASGVICYGPQLLAATAAGTQIKNLATVTYEDAAGNVYSAQSNEAIVTVAQVYAATLGVDNDTTAAAGQLVYLPYVLTNTGNGTDTFDLTAANGIVLTGGDDLDSANITVYEDANGNGVPDAGEPAISSVTLPANVDNLTNLVVAVEVPANATAGQTLGVTLTATAQQGGAGSVIDLSNAGGRDGVDGTNESLITITGDAVLVTTKSSVHDVVNGTIAYTITVRNNGNQSATDVVIFDGLPENTTFVSAGVSGLLASNGDILGTAAAVPLDEVALTIATNTDPSLRTDIDFNADGDASDAATEAALGIDLNTDGDTIDTGITGIYAVDAELPSQASVTLTFTVSYAATLPGGTIIENIGHAAGDTNGDGTADSLSSSNLRQDIIPADFGVIISDTGAGAGPTPGINDGGDDDANANDDQFVDQISTAGTVLFTNVITNTGNADDIFELSVNPGNFPVGTVFTFFDDSGVVQLPETNGSGIDSGVIASGASKTIILKATLPASASGAAPAPATEYEATVTAISANDPAAAPVSDTVANSLGLIVEADADIHNTAGGALGTNDDPLGAAPALFVTGTVGTTVNIPLFIDNESGGSDSYVLTTGSSWDGTTLGALPAGWSVEFFEVDAAGAPTGAPVTSTPVLPAGLLDYPMVAVVSIPSDSALAVEDALFDNNNDGTPTSLDGNNDGDGDYPLYFQIVSPNTGATDIVLDAVDVDSTRQLSLVTPGSNQVEAGGTAAYGHTLTNNGNVTEVVEIEATNSQAAWSSTVSIDTDGNGIADTVLGNLVAGVITVQQPDGTNIVIEVTDVDNDSVPELTLEPGEVVPLAATVFAPANAAPGETDVLTISANNTDTLATAPSVTVNDQTTVINGQVRLTKTVAVDIDCDGFADDIPELPTTFQSVQSVGIEPGQCAVWRVIAENQGTTQANNVTITDSVPAYSAYLPGTLKYCLAAACAPAQVTDGPADDAGNIIGNNIVFYVGPNADPSAGEGGDLVAGQRATAQFAVQVQ
ncbi:MAG: DUF11 domain-containing protein [Granulosicoccaceae bacterium]